MTPDALYVFGSILTWLFQMLRLREFHSQGYKFARLMDPYYTVHELDPTAEEILWSMVDYGTMCSDVKATKLAMSGAAVPDPPFASSLDLNFGLAGDAQTQTNLMGPENDIYPSMMSGVGVGLHEVDYLMDMASSGKTL